MAAKNYLIASILFLQICLIQSSVADSEAAVSFAPTWKLLNSEQKQQFIAGYFHGWRDAERVIQIAKEYIKENPEQAVNGLQKIGDLYNLSGIKPELLVESLDIFFSNPDNKNASLSQAVSASKHVLQR